MKILKWSITLLLVLALVVSAVACGNKDKETGDDPTVTDGDNEAARAVTYFSLGNYTVTAGEVEDEYAAFLDYLAQYGQTAPTDEDTIAEYVALVRDQLLSRYSILHKADELDLALTDEELAAIEESIEYERQEYISYYSELVRSEYETNETEISDEDLYTEAMAVLEEEAQQYLGISFDEYMNQYGDNLRIEERIAKVQAYIESEITLDDAELQTYYDETLSTQMASYAEDATLYKSDMEAYGLGESDTPALWIPEGYATVSLITVAPTGSLDAEHTANAETLAALEAEFGRLVLADADLKRQADIRLEYDELKAAYDSAYEEYTTEARTAAAAALAELQDGADFAETMGKYNADEAADNRLVYLAEADSDFDTIIWTAITKMEAGQTSEVIEIDGVFYIIRFVEKLESKTTPLSDVSDALRSIVLSTKMEEVWTATQDEWLTEAFNTAEINEDAIAYIGKS